MREKEKNFFIFIVKKKKLKKIIERNGTKIFL